MTYSDNLLNAAEKSNYFILMIPRRKVTSGWTNLSGNIYYQSFTYGFAAGGSYLSSGTRQVLTYSSSFATLGSDRISYDYANEVVYINIGSNPNSSTVAIDYEIYLSTIPTYLPRRPTAAESDTYPLVYWNAVILKSPRIREYVGDTVFSSLPVFVSSIEAENLDSFFDIHLYDSSFSKVPVKIYHSLGDFTDNENNIKFLKSATTGSKIQYSDRKISFPIKSETDFFDREYRPGSDSAFFNTTDFANVDPNYIGRPIRKIYGYVDGFIPVNVDYNDTAPTTSNNRDWVVRTGSGIVGRIINTVPASPASTTTRTYVSNTGNYNIGDRVFIDSSAGPGSDEYPLITNTNMSSAPYYIEHAAITAAASSSNVYREVAGRIIIVRDGTVYEPYPGRDYFQQTNASPIGTYGFTFDSFMETNTGLPSAFDPTIDIIYCRAYSDNSSSDGIDIMKDIMDQLADYADVVTEDDTFTTAKTYRTDTLGFAIPQRSTENYPTMRKLIEQLALNLLVRVKMTKFSSNTNQRAEIGISAIEPFGTPAKTVDKTEIIKNSFKYVLSYDDIISDVNVEYFAKEINIRNEISGELTYSKVTSTDDDAFLIHNIRRQKTFKSYHDNSSDAQTYANRLKYILANRLGIATIISKNEFFDREINDVVTVKRERIPGNAFVEDTEQTRQFAIVSLDKALQNIVIQLDDQFGIEENSGSW